MRFAHTIYTDTNKLTSPTLKEKGETEKWEEDAYFASNKFCTKQNADGNKDKDNVEKDKVKQRRDSVLGLTQSDLTNEMLRLKK